MMLSLYWRPLTDPVSEGLASPNFLVLSSVSTVREALLMANVRETGVAAL